MADLITDGELLSMGAALVALNGIDSSVRASAITAASDVALSYVKKRYALPLIQWGSDLKRAVAHIAAYDLLCTRGFNPAAAGDPAVKDRHDVAVLWLRDVAKGLAELVDCVDSTPALEEKGPLLVSATTAPLWGDYGANAGRRNTGGWSG